MGKKIEVSDSDVMNQIHFARYFAFEAEDWAKDASARRILEALKEDIDLAMDLENQCESECLDIVNNYKNKIVSKQLEIVDKIQWLKKYEA